MQEKDLSLLPRCAATNRRALPMSRGMKPFYRGRMRRGGATKPRLRHIYCVPFSFGRPGSVVQTKNRPPRDQMTRGDQNTHTVEPGIRELGWIRDPSPSLPFQHPCWGRENLAAPEIRTD